MNLDKTRAYYQSPAADAKLCTCNYCKNYVKEIKSTYPLLADYLQCLGVDIEKPFETGPLEPDDRGHIDYIFAQYILLGSSEGFQEKKIEGVDLYLACTHPETDIKESHFVLDFSPLRLRWTF